MAKQKEKKPTEKKADEKTVEGTIDNYMYGGLAGRLVDSDQPDYRTAVDVMKSAYYKNATDPIHAIAYLQAYNSQSVEDFSRTAVGQRVAIEQGRYQHFVQNNTLDELLKSTLAKGLETEVANAISEKHGGKTLKDANKSMKEYKIYSSEAKAKYEREAFEAETDDEKKALKKAYDEEMKKLADKYKVKDNLEITTTVHELEEARFAALRRDAVLKSIYVHTVDNMEKLANAPGPKAE